MFQQPPLLLLPCCHTRLFHLFTHTTLQTLAASRAWTSPQTAGASPPAAQSPRSPSGTCCPCWTQQQRPTPPSPRPSRCSRSTPATCSPCASATAARCSHPAAATAASSSSSSSRPQRAPSTAWGSPTLKTGGLCLGGSRVTPWTSLGCPGAQETPTWPVGPWTATCWSGAWTKVGVVCVGVCLCVCVNSEQGGSSWRDATACIHVSAGLSHCLCHLRLGWPFLSAHPLAHTLSLRSALTHTLRHSTPTHTHTLNTQQHQLNNNSNPKQTAAATCCTA